MPSCSFLNYVMPKMPGPLLSTHPSCHVGPAAPSAATLVGVITPWFSLLLTSLTVTQAEGHAGVSPSLPKPGPQTLPCRPALVNKALLEPRHAPPLTHGALLPSCCRGQRPCGPRGQEYFLSCPLQKSLLN